jgi:hypothetical protein
MSVPRPSIVIEGFSSLAELVTPLGNLSRVLVGDLG